MESDNMEEENHTWMPKTKLGKEVAEGIVTNIDEIFSRGLKIKEPEIVDKLLPGLKSEVIFIGGSPGKGGGIKRTPTKRTARMHRSGRRYRISSIVILGDRNGHIGIGKAVSNENVKAISKATENAKLNIMPIRRGCGSWECGCGEKHSIPFEIKGKSGSVTVVLKPAPKGIKSCISREMRKVIELAGITDIWSKSFGNTRARNNMVMAVIDAFRKMNSMKVDWELKEEEKTKDEEKEKKPVKKRSKKKTAKKEIEAIEEDSRMKKPEGENDEQDIQEK